MFCSLYWIRIYTGSSLDQFAGKGKGAGRSIRTSTFMVLALSWKKGDLPPPGRWRALASRWGFQVPSGLIWCMLGSCPWVKEGWSVIITGAQVQWLLQCSWSCSNEGAEKAKIWIYWSICAPILTFGQELWTMTETGAPRFKRLKQISSVGLVDFPLEVKGGGRYTLHYFSISRKSGW